MKATAKDTRRTEYGDFQTPDRLAQRVCHKLVELGVTPASIVEPTCGLGSFLLASLDAFPKVKVAVGYDINQTYVQQARKRVKRHPAAAKASVKKQNFFTADWIGTFSSLPKPILVIGNPPWVTNAVLGSLGSNNLPTKSNFQGHKGLDAITGKSNFDISEWMLLRMIEWVDENGGWLAQLCKTAVARKLLHHAWRSETHLSNASMAMIDAKEEFDAAVDACLLICEFSSENHVYEAAVYPNLEAENADTHFGYRDGALVADVEAYDRHKHLRNQEEPSYVWRSGIKHDCSRVMELVEDDDVLRNGLGDVVSIEQEYLFPMLKTSELAKGLVEKPKRWMIVTQRSVGADTSSIEGQAPKTWGYLIKHGELLDRRASSIYRNRPRFSIFGVGEYSFAPWKVAISGFYKNLNFNAVGPFDGKPTVLDDTSYFLACQTEAEAKLVAKILNSRVAREFFSAFVFWDAKRPITSQLLHRLDILALASKLRLKAKLLSVTTTPPSGSIAAGQQTQKLLGFNR